MFKVYATLTKAVVMQSDVVGLDNCFTEIGSHVFSGLEIQYQQMQHFKGTSNLLYVQGVIFVLSYSHLHGRSLFLYYLESIVCGNVKRRCVTKKDKFYYVSVLDVLRTLLNNQIVLSEVFVFY